MEEQEEAVEVEAVVLEVEIEREVLNVKVEIDGHLRTRQR